MARNFTLESNSFIRNIIRNDSNEKPQNFFNFNNTSIYKNNMSIVKPLQHFGSFAKPKIEKTVSKPPVLGKRSSSKKNQEYYDNSENIEDVSFRHMPGRKS